MAWRCLRAAPGPLVPERQRLLTAAPAAASLPKSRVAVQSLPAGEPRQHPSGPSVPFVVPCPAARTSCLPSCSRASHRDAEEEEEDGGNCCNNSLLGGTWSPSPSSLSATASAEVLVASGGGPERASDGCISGGSACARVPATGSAKDVISNTNNNNSRSISQGKSKSNSISKIRSPTRRGGDSDTTSAEQLQQQLHLQPFLPAKQEPYQHGRKGQQQFQQQQRRAWSGGACGQLQGPLSLSGSAC